MTRASSRRRGEALLRTGIDTDVCCNAVSKGNNPAQRPHGRRCHAFDCHMRRADAFTDGVRVGGGRGDVARQGDRGDPTVMVQ